MFFVSLFYPSPTRLLVVVPVGVVNAKVCAKNKGEIRSKKSTEKSLRHDGKKQAGKQQQQPRRRSSNKHDANRIVPQR
ncbi:hypothetical protein TRSC58_07478 [Trypanosoma rangeli SC58]|uniref:Uncharacterized protein n=1 Tax=Trypanosoma rangeli SC58 TaxID=429131 RepID=A0A061IRL4_TRYRA|nr:hypothetical protein TRSC58_07478 [Trypanosoma rangeli SC58]